jgi:predicted dithiol-disulfide oxidoreductase (DUF899 family)
MAYPEIVTREEWLAARKRLLTAEKEHTRSRDALNAERRRLPMVRIGKEYVFEGPEGKVTLAGLFGDSRQLIVQHVMFDPDWDAACPGCTASIDELSDGVLTHLRSRDTAFALVSRAPLAKLQKYQASRGWRVAWYSSHGSDFNYDFQATLDRSIPQLSTTTGPSRRSSAATPPRPRCPALAASCATATTSSTPTRLTRAAPTASAAPTRCWT